MNISFDNKTALVCGSTQGIGWAAAKMLAEAGCRVVLMARNAKKLEERKNQLPGSGHEVLVADFDHPEKVKETIAAFCKKNTVNILVNNTGGPPAGLLTQAEDEAFLTAFTQHLINNHNLVKAVVPGMKKSGYGRIINIISTSVRAPLPNLGVSNTVRGAVANWSKTLASELGPDGITVNNVLPGATQTSRLDGLIEKKSEKTGRSQEDVAEEMRAEIPARRFAKPEEVASAIVYLASAQAAYISGINISVDGGRTPCY